MNLRHQTIPALILATFGAWGAAGSAHAAVVQLDFEGAGNEVALLEFYNGGTDAAGNSGTNYGVSFGANSLSIIDRDAGGSGNFGNEPTPNTILFFLTGSAVLNYSTGFTEGFSFYYTTTNFAGSVKVYDGLNATGNLLGSISLEALGVGPGDPNGAFSNWKIGSLAFAGSAKSIDFGGTVNQVGYDNITFGSVSPTTPAVPEPESITLMLAGLGLVGATRLRKRRTPAA